MSTPGRAVLVEGPRRHRLIETPTPVPGPEEALVRVHAAGLCGSDRELYEGTRAEGYVRYPIVPGHEWSGTVEAVGRDVERSLVGRRTVGEGFRNCRSCARCRAGETSLCSAGYAETGFTLPGAFADHLVLPARLLHPLPEDADPDAAALLEPAAVAAAAVLTAAPRAGERIAVVGAGTLGLLALHLLAAGDPAELMAVDPRPRAGERARKAGAHHIRRPAPDPGGHDPGGYDLVVETAGAPGSADAACRLARRGGRVVLTGIPAPGARGVDPVLLATAQLTVSGIFGAPSAAWRHAVRAFAEGALRPGELITHRLPLTAFAEAVELVGGGDPDAGKVLLVP
ncbi:alcohol dehydrogenase catalytic domain-containing protein [Streptomyces sp. ST2-7A]|uniref:zinc-dependent alcohol dehydrogenase n=1 Tax=Streptomyces sp. ST2-7A TaxID=2907214 RepID=UPI001F2FDBE4|nr:alcohol dehydrogenase catalytic domain-containing protein [Streptomyces sp. ST2-7A]MCE7082660.1 alcohol dehydrogenase catalytic domain-containing protein [Streptomyces sp. ST2-7A]